MTKNRHSSKTNPSKNYQKYLISSKKKDIPASVAPSGPYRQEIHQTRPLLTKNSQINPFVVKSILESKCKRFRNTSIRGNFNPKPDPQRTKTQPNKRRDWCYHNIEVNSSCIPFHSFMSQKRLITRSMTSLFLENFHFFLGLAGQKHISNKQVHQGVPLMSFKTQALQSTE